MILVIDNYDSFVHNVARHLAVLGAETRTVRNDVLTTAGIRRLAPDAIVISPGPCTPAEAGISCAVLDELSGEIPILGVCLGHQCMGTVFGGRVARAQTPLHGQSSAIRHGGERLFSGLPRPMMAGRYHSLIVEPTPALEAALHIDAVSPEGEIMALSHRALPVWGVQFHPESVLTPDGLALFETFLLLAKGRVEAADAVA